MNLYVVTTLISGYAREDSDVAGVAGVYTDFDVANKIKIAAGFGSEVHTISLNDVKDGYAKYLTDLYQLDIREMIKLKQAKLRSMDAFDRHCLMSLAEFEECVDDGGIIPDDGIGKWATDSMVSEVSCFSKKPSWATHVCWYNN